MTAIAAYVSGHGFGHFTRSEAVLERVARAGVRVHLRTDQRALPLARRVPWAASVTEVDTGPGVLQRGPIEVALEETLVALERYLRDFDRLAATEGKALRALGVDAVYADVPPVAFEAAGHAGVPAIGLANFSWSWIYEGYETRSSRFARFAARLAEAERGCGLFLRLPLSGGLEHFPRATDVPLVVRAPTRSREEARRLLPVPPSESRPVVLLSFGGFGDAFDLAGAAARNPGFFFVAFAPPRGAPPPDNVGVLAHDHPFPHQDLVLGADAVLGKPGYGTVAEAIVAGRAFVHCPRGEFREYPVLVRALERHVPQAAITTEELLAGEWTRALEEALAAPPGEALAADGAEVAARHVLEVLRQLAR